MKTTQLLALAAALSASAAAAQDKPTVPAPVVTNETIKPQPAAAIPSVTATSPDGSIVVTLATDGEGHASYAIMRKGETIVAPSRLGFLFTDAPKLDRHLQIVQVTRAASDTNWTQPWGEWTTIRDNHNELRVHLQETSPPGRSLDVVFRIQNDGVGFRYEFPEQAGGKPVNIAEELTQFA
ncbi:glycoside hydrolase family 97 N-terminal domain-containing protein, partial [Sphingomonas sp.]|uniref:glycoside hydrolase family 97 N-terminal domain-containing protein n=1 Tax=Sphingomonas sp. TaxID=28214 RepID=UPI00333F4AE0